MEFIAKLRGHLESSGAFSGSRYAGGPLDLHAHLAAAIRALPAKYQPPTWMYRWQPGRSPLSTDAQVAVAVVVYLSTIFGVREIMKDRKAFKFATLFQIHNLLLTGASGLLLTLMLQEILPIVYKHGLFYAICNTKSWTARLETYYIVNYLFKYWELLDTLFLVVKKKPLAFLHVYHHAATAVLCYTQLNGKTSISWIVITLNLFVHVIMYYYYWATAAGYKIWWKRYVTVLQISQFVIDLGMVYFGTYSHFAYEFFPRLPCRGDCAGTEYAALQGCAILTSYLLLFISFYRKTYEKASARRDVRKAMQQGGAHANGKAVNGIGNGSARGRADSLTKVGLAADSLFDETCGPAGVNKSTGTSGFNTPVVGPNGKAR